jgi:hypothetical protein
MGIVGNRIVAAVVLPVVCSLLLATVVAIPIGLILLTAFSSYLLGGLRVGRIAQFILARLQPASGCTPPLSLGLFATTFLLHHSFHRINR